MTDKDFADHLDAQDRLRARGYTQETCKVCKGLGFEEMPRLSGNGTTFFSCGQCGGKGYLWKAPLARDLTSGNT